MPDTTQPPLTNAELEQVNGVHLRYLETISKDRTDLQSNSLDLLPIFTYELIQMLNHQYLRVRLGA